MWTVWWFYSQIHLKCRRRIFQMKVVLERCNLIFYPTVFLPFLCETIFWEVAQKSWQVVLEFLHFQICGMEKKLFLKCVCEALVVFFIWVGAWRDTLSVPVDILMFLAFVNKDGQAVRALSCIFLVHESPPSPPLDGNSCRPLSYSGRRNHPHFQMRRQNGKQM